MHNSNFGYNFSSFDSKNSFSQISHIMTTIHKRNHMMPVMGKKIELLLDDTNHLTLLKLQELCEGQKKKAGNHWTVGHTNKSNNFSNKVRKSVKRKKGMVKF